MGMSSHRRSGVLVIRAWLEDGEAAELRARLLSVDDIEAGEERVSWAASVEEVCAAVTAWLEDIKAAG
jgi:hypothetical protein